MDKKTGSLFVVSAPSGAGKTTLTQALIKRLQPSCDLKQVVTYTTKKLREDETDKHSLSVAEFERRAQEGFFLEWSTAYEHYYGSPRQVLDDIKQGDSFIMTLDRAGASSVSQIYAQAVLVWIYPENLEVLRQRLVERGRDTHEQIEHRIALARQELDAEKNSPFYHFHICNAIFEDALQEFETIIRKKLAL